MTFLDHPPQVNRPPTLTTPSTALAYVYEKTPDAFVMLPSGRNFTLNFTDPNYGAQGETYTFFISGGTGRHRFTMLPSKGIIRVNSSAPAIVWQTNPSFTLACFVRDSTGLSSAVVTYTITTLNIIDPPLMKNVVITTPSGTYVDTVLPTTVSPFYIEPGDSCSYFGKPSSYLRLSSGGAVVVTTTLPKSVSQDYNLTFFCTNSKGARSNNATIVVRAVQGESVPSMKYHTYNVPENATVGSLIIRNLTSKVNYDGTAGYSFALRNFNTMFSINTTTGAIKLLQPLNVNSGPFYNVTVQLTSAGPSKLSSTQNVGLVVTAVPHAPTFSLGTSIFSILETAMPGANVSVPIIATDRDAGQSASLKYAMRYRYPWSIRSYYNHTAQARYARLFLNTSGAYPQLDFTATSSYLLTIYVRDVTNRLATASVQVSVIAVNAPPTVSNYSVTVPESAGVGTTVATVVGRNRLGYTLAYYILKATGSGYGRTTDALSVFTISATTGVIKTAAALDFEATTVYRLQVLVQQVSDPSFHSVSYVNVAVGDVNDLSVTSLTTALGSTYTTGGGTAVTLTGTNFGPVYPGSAVSVTALYGGEDGYSYQASGCAVTVANTQAVCYAAAGVGAGQTWIVTVGSWTTRTTQTYAYEPPRVAFVAFDDGIQNATTTGGARVAIYGTNFGPARPSVLGSSLADIVKVAVGTSAASLSYTCGSAYVANNSYVYMGGSYDRIVCTLGPGAGRDLYFAVSLGVVPQSSTWTQTSAAFQSTLDYMRPSISAVAGPVLGTTGGDKVTLTGANFGPSDGTVTVTARYGNNLVGLYSATSCLVTNAHTTIVCKTVAGIGKALSWLLTVSDQTSAPGASTLRYRAPTITGVGGIGARRGDTAGGEPLTITGTSFGPTTSLALPVVTYGDTGTEYSAQSCAVTVADTQAVCVTGPGTGRDLNAVIAIAQQHSPVFDANMSYNSPVVEYYVAQWEEDVSATGGRTKGGQYVIINGQNFGTVEVRGMKPWAAR
jgi:hypothetical protein